jgi:hypothetical protein
MELAPSRHPLNGCDLFSIGLNSQKDTGEYRTAIQQNRAGPALPLVAPSLRPFHPQPFAEDIQKEGGGLDPQSKRDAVHLYNDGNHIRFQAPTPPQSKNFTRRITMRKSCFSF